LAWRRPYRPIPMSILPASSTTSWPSPVPRLPTIRRFWPSGSAPRPSPSRPTRPQSRTAGAVPRGASGCQMTASSGSCVWPPAASSWRSPSSFTGRRGSASCSPWRRSLSTRPAASSSAGASPMDRVASPRRSSSSAGTSSRRASGSWSIRRCRGRAIRAGCGSPSSTQGSTTCCRRSPRGSPATPPERWSATTSGRWTRDLSMPIPRARRSSPRVTAPGWRACSSARRRRSVSCPTVTHAPPSSVWRIWSSTRQGAACAS
jgi:hypothetical protein